MLFTTKSAPNYNHPSCLQTLCNSFWNKICCIHPMLFTTKSAPLFLNNRLSGLQNQAFKCMHTHPQIQPDARRWHQMLPECSIWTLSALGSRSRQNELRNDRFEQFLPMAPEVNKMSSRMLDLSTFCPWLQKSIAWAPECAIWALSALGSRSR